MHSVIINALHKKRNIIFVKLETQIAIPESVFELLDYVYRQKNLLSYVILYRHTFPYSF